MKSFSTMFIAGASLFAVSQAVIVNLYASEDCSGDATSRNVYDNTCAYVAGFNSYEVTTYGGDLQQFTAYSRQACAGAITSTSCAAGVDKVALNECQTAYNGDGGSNAISSYSNGAACPN